MIVLRTSNEGYTYLLMRSAISGGASAGTFRGRKCRCRGLSVADSSCRSTPNYNAIEFRSIYGDDFEAFAAWQILGPVTVGKPQHFTGESTAVGHTIFDSQ